MKWLIINILTSVAILSVFRGFEKFRIQRNQAIVVSYLVSFILSFSVRETGISWNELSTLSYFQLAIFIGVSFYIGFQLFARSTNKIGMAITSVSGNTSVVIPVTIALLFYSEEITFAKLTGIFIVLSSFFLIFKKKNNEKLDLHFIYLPILLFLVNGLNASLMAYTEKLGSADYKMNFMMVIFLSAFSVGIINLLFNRTREKLTLRTLIASILLGTLNFISTVVILIALQYLPDSIFFPVYNSGYIVIAALVGFFVFKEKLSTINWLGIFLALTGIIILTSGL